MVNYDTPGQYLNFNCTDCWYSSLFGVTWPSNQGCSTFSKCNLPHWVDRLSRVYLFIYIYEFAVTEKSISAPSDEKIQRRADI